MPMPACNIQIYTYLPGAVNVSEYERGPGAGSIKPGMGGPPRRHRDIVSHRAVRGEVASVISITPVVA